MDKTRSLKVFRMATPPQPPQSTSKSLFSLHYLETRLPDHAEWHEDGQAVFAAVGALWQRAHELGASWNEAQTEDELVKPILELLGWRYIPQVKNRSRGRINRPDYALFADQTARDAAYPHQGEDAAFYNHALAIAEAKYWGRPLSQKDASGRDTWKTDNNPSHQMVSYLVGTRCAWGILTNGRVWRLYSREVSSTASEFYEIDLDGVFASTEIGAIEEIDAFKRWWLFFRRASFTPDAQGRSFVQRIHDGSATYAKEISDKLKELVFREVMPEIAGGFVAYRHRQLGIEHESVESLRQIYQASLSLLYKLLFVLYAEARSLLPIANPAYWEESLTRMAQGFADRIDRGQAISDATHATRQYDALLALFRRIDQGDASLGVPRYDGGLFNPASPDNQFLSQHKLSDRAVARAVDILVRDAGQPVDYAYISVRNLGSIYEGLLENKLQVEDAAAGRVALVNDKGERKATGSYYTPDYIVDYIVEQTLTPILDERQSRFAAAMERIAGLRRQLEKTDNPGIVNLLRPQLAQAERTAREAFLGIKVCDPAMGSGHFLVNAVDFITDAIIEQMQSYHDIHPDQPWAWNPLQRLIEQVRTDILAEMGAQGIAIDPLRLDDTALLTRLVMKRCIYGVDLNPMAVELAKLSLWLHSFTVGAPLSFLDHHLRWGNSLIGADVRTVEETLITTRQTQSISKAARQLAAARGERVRDRVVSYQANLFGGPFAGLLDLTALMLEIAQQADSTLADVRQSAEHYRHFQASLLPYKQTLDLWVSQHFGNAGALDFLESYPTDVLPALRGERQLSKVHTAAIEDARQLWQEKRFFHWDLEFPEVFIDLEQRNWAENPGFDAVIGNPPYVRSVRLKEADPATWAYYSKRFQAASTREFDIYLCFAELGLNLLRSDGYSGVIIPNKWFTTRVGESLRSLLSFKQAVRQIVDFGSFQVFEDVTTYTCLLFLAGAALEQLDVAALRFAEDKSQPLPGDTGVWQAARFDSHTLKAEPWSFSFGGANTLLRGFNQLPRLETVAAVFKGTGTSADSVFMMERRGDQYYSRSLEQWIEIEHGIMRPSLTGRDIDSYHYDTDHYLLFPYEFAHDQICLLSSSQLSNNYPKAWAYLNNEKNRKILEARDLGVFQGRSDWYAYARPQNMHLLGLPKLVGPDVAGQAEFTCDFEGRYIIDTVYGIRLREDIKISLSALAAILNSSLMTFFLQQTGTNLRGGYFRMKTAYLNPFPIPSIDFTTSADERTRYAEKGRRLYEQFCAKADYACVLGFVEHHLAAGQSDVVHDLLAFLAEQMIELNKQKQAEMKGFLAWLQREIGANIDALTNKTALQNYLGDYQKGEPHLTLDGLLEVLKKNRRKLAIDPSRRAFQEQLAPEYEASLDKLLPIKRQLAATDRLIDRVVYHLYGLSDEEITLVEGAPRPDIVI
jgi:hypothetical protein